MTRETLPFRRFGRRVTLVCKHGNVDKLPFDAHFNFYADGRLGELFARPFKTGQQLEGFLDKFCIGLSLALQSGVTIQDLAKAMGENATPMHRDMFGAIVAAGVEAETAMKEDLRVAGGAAQA